jgi:hypothetical protein
MILILMLISLNAQASCMKSVKRQDLDLILKGTPPAYAIRHDCSGDDCVCVPDEAEVNTSSLSVYDLSKEGLSINEERKAIAESEKERKESDKSSKEQRVELAKQALSRAESESDKVNAIAELLKAKDDL